MGDDRAVVETPEFGLRPLHPGERNLPFMHRGGKVSGGVCRERVSRHTLGLSHGRAGGSPLLPRCNGSCCPVSGGLDRAGAPAWSGSPIPGPPHQRCCGQGDRSCRDRGGGGVPHPLAAYRGHHRDPRSLSRSDRYLARLKRPSVVGCVSMNSSKSKTVLPCRMRCAR